MDFEAQMMRIRLSPTLKQWLRVQAKQNCRTMNAEIVLRLEVARMGEKSRPTADGVPAAGQEA